MRNGNCNVLLLTLALLTSAKSSSAFVSHSRINFLPGPIIGTGNRRQERIRKRCPPPPQPQLHHKTVTNSNNDDNLIYNPTTTTTEVEEDDYVYVAATDALYTGDPNDHRYSASDWLANVKSLPRSTILRAIQGPVISVMVWSFVVSVVHGILKRFGGVVGLQWANAMCISNKPHSFLVSALGLLLVFRTNSAYQRFAEGRAIWENILSLSRNISRLASLYERDVGGERRNRIFRLLGAFPYLLHHHIQPQCLDQYDYSQLKGTKFAIKLEDSADLCSLQENESNNDNGNILAYLSQKIRRPGRNQKKKSTNDDDEDVYCGLEGEDCETCLVDRRALPWCLLPPAALRKCASSQNRPLWICDRLSQELTDVGYSDNFTSRERLAFLSQIDKLSKCIGECERIHQTAVPLNYARHSLRSLTIWLFTLPFALVDEFGIFFTAPVMAVISWLLFGVYQIGSTIEDPFQGSLRLSILCDAIYRDVMYDANFKNNRDSAFQLESELVEWNRLGPVGGENSKPILALPSNGTPEFSSLVLPKSQPASSPASSALSQTNPTLDPLSVSKKSLPTNGDSQSTSSSSSSSSLSSSILPPENDPLEPRP